MEFDGPICYLHPPTGDKRSIIVVKVGDTRQPFYRSTGNNSGQPGRWFPFDGITLRYGYWLWFEKSNYIVDICHRLDRFGTTELKNISDELEKLSIPEGDCTSDAFYVNTWINGPRSEELNKILGKRSEAA